MFLKADGTVLRNRFGTGDIVTLKGTNVGGWQVMESWMCPTNAQDQRTTIHVFTERFGREKAEELIRLYEAHWWQEQDFENVKNLHFNALRLPLCCYSLLDEEGGLRKDTLALCDWFVEQCVSRGIYVILDLHAAPGSQNGRDHSGDSSGSRLYSDRKCQLRTISLWKQLAEHYRGNPAVAGYDLLNEPEGPEEMRDPWGERQIPFFDELYRAVRQVDSDHVIILNPTWGPGDIPHPDRYGWENVMYEYHFYCWEGIDDVECQRRHTDSNVAEVKAAGHGVPLLVGEFTLFDRMDSWKYALQKYNENGWSWTTWTYKTVGMGCWGIYTADSGMEKVDIYRDSAQAIAEKWSRVDTEPYFPVNRNLADILCAMAAGE